MYHGDAQSDAGKVVTADGRNGGLTAEHAYNGTNSNTYYQTPQEFFNGDERDDAADTTKGVVGVLDKNGEVREGVRTSNLHPQHSWCRRDPTAISGDAITR